MLNKEIFIKSINTYQEYISALERLGKAISGRQYYNIFETDWNESVDKLFDLFLESHFTREAKDLIYWHMFENVPKVIYETVEADIFNKEEKKEINVEDLDDLWNYMIKYKEEYFK